jgi:hypothetical protein
MQRALRQRLALTTGQRTYLTHPLEGLMSWVPRGLVVRVGVTIVNTGSLSQERPGLGEWIRSHRSASTAGHPDAGEVRLELVFFEH